jgi:hypothetical protein
MAIELDRLLAKINRQFPATENAIDECQNQLNVKLPREYVMFLRTANGGEGFIGNSYIILWGAEELVCMNEAYEVQRYVPGLLIFGSSGGGEAYGFDTRPSRWNIVQVPFVGMAWDLAQPMGVAFSEFLNRLHDESESSRQAKPKRLHCQGREIFEITPIILGGNPIDSENKTVLNRQDHIKAVVHWNKVIKELRDKRGKSGGE